MACKQGEWKNMSNIYDNIEQEMRLSHKYGNDVYVYDPLAEVQPDEDRKNTCVTLEGAASNALLQRIDELNRQLRKVQDRLGKVRASNRNLKAEAVEAEEHIEYLTNNFKHIGLGFYRLSK